MWETVGGETADIGGLPGPLFTVKAVDDIVAVNRVFVGWAVVSRRCVVVFGWSL